MAAANTDPKPTLIAVFLGAKRKMMTVLSFSGAYQKTQSFDQPLQGILTMIDVHQKFVSLISAGFPSSLRPGAEVQPPPRGPLMILCADDFGLREDIDEAVIELCSLNKLSAVSLMVLFERCSPKLLSELEQFRGRLDLGLHLCCTDEGLALSSVAGVKPLFFRSFASCLASGQWGKLSPRDVILWIAAQYDLFTAKCGAAPDYIDGHLHIHQAPVIRDAMIEFLLGLPEKRRPYVRNTCLSTRLLRRRQLPWVKAWLIGLLGKPMARRLRGAGIRTNDGFAGIYDFGRAREFPSYFPRFLECLNNPTGILVVHPGHSENWRRQEFETLRDAEITVSLNRFAQ